IPVKRAAWRALSRSARATLRRKSCGESLAQQIPPAWLIDAGPAAGPAEDKDRSLGLLPLQSTPDRLLVADQLSYSTENSEEPKRPATSPDPFHKKGNGCAADQCSGIILKR